MSRYQFKLATAPDEIAAYFALRHSIFVEEQQLFQNNDVDDIDQIAYPIIAVLAKDSTGESLVNERETDQETNWNTVQGISREIDQETNQKANQEPIVGVVRIYETQPGLWYGGRLGTHCDYRKGWQIGKGLIYKAVTTANTWGCDRFLATVQLQNVRFFQRLHWQSLEEITICDRPHHLMQADLNFYPAANEPRPVLPFRVREAS